MPRIGPQCVRDGYHQQQHPMYTVDSGVERKEKGKYLNWQANPKACKRHHLGKSLEISKVFPDRSNFLPRAAERKRSIETWAWLWIWLMSYATGTKRAFCVISPSMENHSKRSKVTLWDICASLEKSNGSHFYTALAACGTNFLLLVQGGKNQWALLHCKVIVWYPQEIGTGTQFCGCSNVFHTAAQYLHVTHSQAPSQVSSIVSRLLITPAVLCCVNAYKLVWTMFWGKQLIGKKLEDFSMYSIFARCVDPLVDGICGYEAYNLNSWLY